MKITKKLLSELKRPEKNIRLHTDKQLVEFRRSVEMFGQIRPIVIDEDGVIWAGNGLYETLLSMGRTEADCYIVAGLSDAQKKKLMLADNRIFDLGVDDMVMFDSFILDLKDDLDVPGFDEDMLKSLVMNEAEVDELLSDYGVVSQERIEEIRGTQTRYEARDEAAAAAATEHQPAADPGDEAGGHRFVLCPKCGERIWL